MAEELAQDKSLSPETRQDIGIGDYYTKIAKSKGGDLMGMYGKVSGEKAESAGKIAGAEAKAKGIMAEGEATLAREEAEKGEKIGKEYRESLRTFDEFKPTQETAADLIGLFGLISFIGAGMGGQGKYSGLAAMNNMGAAMQGYRSGRKDLFEREMKEFEKNVQSAKAFNEQQKTLYDIAMNQLATNTKAGLASLRELAQKETGSVAAEYVKKAQFEELGKFLEKRIDAFEKMKDRMAVMASKTNAIGAMPKDKDTLNQYRARFETIKNIDEIKTLLNDPKYAALIGPETKFTPEVFQNLRANYPELASKLARIQAIEFQIGGKALTQSEQKILEPLYGWRGLTADALRSRLNETEKNFDFTQRLVEEDFPGLKQRRKAYEQAYEQFGKLPPDYSAEGGANKETLRAQAKAAIAAGKNAEAVRARYKEMTGEDLGE